MLSPITSPSHDATVVGRLRGAGAVLVGTHVSHELTCGLDQPPTRNPWALDSYPGGSSAGGGASVAVGSAAFALGTDAAGSVRIPAAMTGVVGFKPTAGLVSAHGVVRHATAPSIDNVGILARTVPEVSAVLEVIAGPDPADAATLWELTGGGAAASAEAPGGLAGRRLGILGDSTRAALDVRTPPEREVWSSFDAACDVLRHLGAELVPVNSRRSKRRPTRSSPSSPPNWPLPTGTSWRTAPRLPPRGSRDARRGTVDPDEPDRRGRGVPSWPTRRGSDDLRRCRSRCAGHTHDSSYRHATGILRSGN